mgnify:FL=1
MYSETTTSTDLHKVVSVFRANNTLSNTFHMIIEDESELAGGYPTVINDDLGDIWIEKDFDDLLQAQIWGNGILNREVNRLLKA